MNPYHGKFEAIIDSVLSPVRERRPKGQILKCADFFCGIGGFHVAANNLGMEVVAACDVNEDAREAYTANYGLEPLGDITTIVPDDIPDYDILCAGFPCQPFSIIGRKQGFSDPRGTLFFQLLRFIRAHRPVGIILENVKQLASAGHGSVIKTIIGDLEGLGYTVDYRILNALDFGLPHKRERTIIAATQSRIPFEWPTGGIPMKPLANILEDHPDQSVYVSPAIRRKRHKAHTAKVSPSIWHENKAGNISSHPWSCALRAGASYNYLLVDGERRLTSRELLRLQGFPDSWKIVCTHSQTRKQAGNAVPVPMVQAVLKAMVDHLGRTETAWADDEESLD